MRLSFLFVLVCLLCVSTEALEWQEDFLAKATSDYFSAKTNNRRLKEWIDQKHLVLSCTGIVSDDDWSLPKDKGIPAKKKKDKIDVQKLKHDPVKGDEVSVLKMNRRHCNFFFPRSDAKTFGDVFGLLANLANANIIHNSKTYCGKHLNVEVQMKNPHAWRFRIQFKEGQINFYTESGKMPSYDNTLKSIDGKVREILKKKDAKLKDKVSDIPSCSSSCPHCEHGVNTQCSLFKFQVSWKNFHMNMFSAMRRHLMVPTNNSLNWSDTQFASLAEFLNEFLTILKVNY